MLTARYEHVLMPVEQIRDRSVARIRNQSGMPERFTGPRVKRNEVTGAVAAEQQIAGGGQQALSSDVGGMLPCDFAGLNINGSQFRFYDTAAALSPGVSFRL